MVSTENKSITIFVLNNEKKMVKENFKRAERDDTQKTK